VTTKATQLGLLTVEQCAQQLQCSVSLVEGFIRAGRLPRVQLTSREVGGTGRGPKNWRVRPETLARFVEELERPEPPRVKPGEVAAPPPPLPVAVGTDGKSRLKRGKK
jgi:hypothetical protein